MLSKIGWMICFVSLVNLVFVFAVRGLVSDCDTRIKLLTYSNNISKSLLVIACVLTVYRIIF